MSAKPTECRALAVMREAGGLKKHELAARLEMAADSYYEYENGVRVPGRRMLERVAAALDLPAHQVDRTLEYLRRADREARAQTAGDADAAAEREIDRLAMALGAEAEELHRSVFQRSRRLARAVADRELARVHFPRLRAYAAAERPAIVRENPAFQSWAMSELAAHESIEAAAGDPDEALAWAELAVLIADLAPGEAAFRARSQGYAAAHRGNAYRVKGRLPEADAEFCRGKELWKAGEAGDPERLFDEARVLGMEASLRRDQRRLPEALELLDRALAADRGGLRTQLLINRAKTLEELGEFDEALATLRRVLLLIDADREPRLFWNVRINKLAIHCHLGQHATAAEEFEGVHAIAVRLGSGIRLARLGWLDGWIKVGLGQHTEAEAAFERVRREFLERDIPYDAALATLELAVLYQEQGRTAEVQKLARELAPAFQAQRVSRELIATLTLFKEAVEKDKLTLELARQLLEQLRRTRTLEET